MGERYVNAATNDVTNLARALFVHHQHFFTFVHEDGIEPTNNAAERALPTAFQWRKIMLSNRSTDGERALERLLTVSRTDVTTLKRISAHAPARIPRPVMAIVGGASDAWKIGAWQWIPARIRVLSYAVAIEVRTAP